jgi:serine/threonine protein kinase
MLVHPQAKLALTIPSFLEYVPGGTISSCLKNYGRFSQEVTKYFTSQILAGLEYLHSKGIIHRVYSNFFLLISFPTIISQDLKAENILVEPTGICKISDFGISKKADVHRGRAFTGMKGTVFWMAPEILSSDGKGYDVKVDIWSVGCIVLEMWTGDRPWSGEELVPVMMKVFHIILAFGA